jgi:triacylglycerol lipase
VFASLAPARRRLAIALAVIVAVAALVGSILAATADGHPGSRPVSQNQPGPVLLVPGYGGSVTGLNTLAEHLRAGGKTADVVHLPDNAQGDLGAQARVLDDAVRTALRASSASSVDVVGYSAGGVVARLWARDYGGAAVARRIVTLGSPQHGTELAALGSLLPGACPTACRQLMPDSTLLGGLNSGSETPAGPTFVSIWTTSDEVVVPADSARLAGALNMTVQSICSASDVTHSNLPTDRVVQGIVADELAAGPPLPLGAADCARLQSG